MSAGWLRAVGWAARLGIESGNPWRRLTLALLASLLPAAVAAGLAVSPLPGEVAPAEYAGIFFWAFFLFLSLHAAVPLAALAAGTAVFQHELATGTASYLLVRPVRRGVLLGARLLAHAVLGLGFLLLSYLACAMLFLAPVGFGERLPEVLASAGVLAVAFLVYLAPATFLATVLRRPFLAGMAALYGWEGFLSFLPGRVASLTLIHHVRGLAAPFFDGSDPLHFQELVEEGLPLAPRIEHLTAGEAWTPLLVATGIFLAAAGWGFRRREVASR